MRNKLSNLADEDFGTIINNGNVFISVIKDKYYWNNLLYDKKVILLKGMKLTPEEMVDFASLFGSLERSEPQEYAIENQPYVGVLSNLIENGKRLGFSDAGHYWHTDGYYLKKPVKATLLYCIAAPKIKGETLFTDATSAYDDLPDHIKLKLNDLKGFCPFLDIYNKSRLRRGLKSLTKEQQSHYQDVKHPIVRTHPETGKKSLYLNQHYLSHIDGMPSQESEQLLNYLYHFATHDDRIYRHRWEVGDLLIWDNASVLHKAVRPDSQDTKTMWRCTIQGEIPF